MNVRALRIVAAGMALSVVAVAALVFLADRRSAVLAPTPEAVHLANVGTMIAMGLAFALIAASEIAWKIVSGGGSSPADGARAARAFIVRTALREAAALIGCAAALPAASAGVLRAYPAYWADLAPAALFVSYLWAHWPSESSQA